MCAYVTNNDLKAFADRKINLKSEEVEEERKKVRHMRDRLETHIRNNPEFSLVKMLHAGSVAKGTGLSDLNDMDVAVYVSSESAEGPDLVLWMAERLREVYGATISPNAIKPSTNCVKIEFSSGFNVDIVPVLDEGEGDGKGYLVAKDTGKKMLTSIPMHLDFIRERKKTHPKNFAQMIRYLKWWIRIQKQQDDNFKFKSFMAELVIAFLAGKGQTFQNHNEAIFEVFRFIAESGLSKRIAFDDYYPSYDLPPPTYAPIEIFDPVNPNNNVAELYTEHDRLLIVNGANQALDALVEASFAVNREQEIACWQVIFGTGFKG